MQCTVCRQYPAASSPCVLRNSRWPVRTRIGEYVLAATRLAPPKGAMRSHCCAESRPHPTPRQPGNSPRLLLRHRGSSSRFSPWRRRSKSASPALYRDRPPRYPSCHHSNSSRSRQWRESTTCRTIVVHFPCAGAGLDRAGPAKERTLGNKPLNLSGVIAII